MAAENKKAFKVVTHDGSKRVGLVVGSLRELIVKGAQKLGLEKDADIRIVLESDATLVEDEDYFQCLEPQTALVFLTLNQDFVPLNRLEGYDETDGPMISTGNGRLDELIVALRADLSKVVAFSPDDLQLLLDMGHERLGEYINVKNGPDSSRLLLEASQRFMDEHIEAKEYASLLQLVAMTMGLQPQQPPPENETDPKRKKRL
ncbi:hypothetical protein CAPTEDRAFT_214998 [Capitella teleta]|uniref:CIDE-N domain-containing protein n=1 Tax=Capitella teleta TaxID=283909 RepID=R7TEE3_CAPTE|nr:hypothetical protein CAPTEDRAFT_214998 [Capitella teleta]|eukprot:ELT92138.1 hypothetical protein CAPTEDRAFT_214998 [Capitella teleta]